MIFFLKKQSPHFSYSYFFVLFLREGGKKAHVTTVRSCRDNRSFCYTAATRTIETNRIIVGSLFRSSASDKMRLSLTSIPKVYCNDRDTQKNWTEEKSTNSSRRPQKMAIEFLNSPFSKNPDGVPVIFSGFSTVRFYCSFVIRFVTRGTSQRP